MKSYFESKVEAVKRWPRALRIAVGVLLILGGLLGFFPVLGFWMIPLGLVVLAVDFRWARSALVNARWHWRRQRRRYRRPGRSAGQSRRENQRGPPSDPP